MFITLSKRLLSLLIIGIFLPISMHGANNIKLDSLLSKHPTSKVERFKNYVAISYFYNRSSLTTQKQYLDSSKLLLKWVSDNPSLASYYTSWGHYYYKKEKFDSSLIMYRSCLNNIDTVNDRYHSGKTLSNIGRVFSRIDNYDSSIYYYKKSIDCFYSIDTSINANKVALLMANTINNIGSVYLNMGDYDKALTYYYRALRIYDDLKQSLRSTVVLINIGNIYLYHENYDKALVEYDKAYHVLLKHKNKRLSSRASVLTNMGVCFKAKGQIDTAMACYERALVIREKIGPMTSKAGLYDNIGNIRKSQGHYKEALDFYQRALKIRQQLGSPRWLASSYANIGLLYAEQKQSKKAIRYLKKAIAIADEISLVEVSIECKKGLAQAYRDLGNYKDAFNYYLEYQELNDSIHSLKLEEKLNEYKQKYESEKKDRMIEHLEGMQKLSDLNAEKQREVNKKQKQVVRALSVAAILLIAILFILYLYFRMKRTADLELFEKNEQINYQKTLKLMKDLEMSSIKSFVEGQEKERSRIAGDLHDRLGSLLATVRIHFNILEEEFEQNPSAKESYEFAMQLLDKSVAEVREVSHNLSKGVLTQFGLIAAVENMRDAINSAGNIQMEVSSLDEISRLDPEVEIHLFRIIQELVTNVIRHAQTNEVIIQFSEDDSTLSILVEDHGVGFDVNNVKSDGIGMKNLNNRIEEINATISFDSIIGEGTSVVIEVPYKRPSENDEDEDKD